MAFSVNRVTSPGINGTDAGRACGGSGQPSQPTTVDSVAVLTGADGATATVESGSSPTGNDVSGQIRSWYGAALTDDGVGAVVGTKDEGQAHRPRSAPRATAST